MATLDWRTFDEAHKGGSDLLKVGLTGAQAEKLPDAGLAADTWILFSFLSDTGGSVGRERDLAVRYSEGGTRDETTNLDEGVIKGAVLQTSKRVLDLLDLLEDEYVSVVRYLPLKKTGPNGETHQVWASERAKLDKENWTIGTGRTDDRSRSFTMRTFKPEGAAPEARPYVLAEVDAADEAGWPASLDFAKEAAFAGA